MLQDASLFFSTPELLDGKQLSRALGSPLRCGPDPMVSVDHVGKLFERIEATNLMDKTNDIETTLSAKPLYQASFCPRHGNRQTVYLLPSIH